MSIAVESYIAAVATEGLKTYYKHGKIEHLFTSEADTKLFAFVDAHARQHGKIPDPATVEKHTGFTLPTPKEPSSYYLEVMRRAYTEKGIREAAKAAEGYLTPAAKDPDKALAAITSALAVVQFKALAQTVLDYREAGPSIKQAYKANLFKDSDSELRFGWPTLDQMSGGLQEGDVISWVGRSGLGKTLALLWSATKMWQQGRVPLFVSMEIKPTPLFQRIAAIHTTMPLQSIKMGTLSGPIRDKFFGHMDALPDAPQPFWVVDGNLKSTAHDIQTLVHQLKPDVLFIDGAYLMKHPTERDRFKRVAENMDLIKQSLAETCPVICSWQFNREGRKLKQGETPGLDHIAGSDSIGTHSSLVLGLFEEESIETGAGRKVTVLKGRNGESGSFSMKWQFEGSTDFSEVVDDPYAPLSA